MRSRDESRFGDVNHEKWQTECKGQECRRGSGSIRTLEACVPLDLSRGFWGNERTLEACVPRTVTYSFSLRPLKLASITTIESMSSRGLGGARRTVGLDPGAVVVAAGRSEL
jgi:hypothetical protein